DERFQDILRIKPDVAVTLSFRKLEDFRKEAPKELTIKHVNGISTWFLSLNLKPTIADFKGKNPLTDVRLRKALAYCMDRHEFVNALTKGWGRPATQIVAPEIFGFNPGILIPENDVAAAKKLVEEAGFANLEIPIYSAEGGSHLFENLLIKQWE